MKMATLENSPRERQCDRPNAALGRFPQGFLDEFEGIAARRVSSAPRVRSRAVVVFQLNAPSARRVQLAADFTEWSRHALSLGLGEDGIWQLTVVLPPGRYAYRFLVDGKWVDDPHCNCWEANRFGTRNAVVDVG